MAVEVPWLNRLTDYDRFPNVDPQAWRRFVALWQVQAEQIEASFGELSDQLAAIQAAQAAADNAQDTADTATDLANAFMPDIAPVTVVADYTGTVLAGQLPRNIAATRFNGSTDVTTSSTWSATTVSGSATYTIGASTGVLNLTALTATTTIEITSVHNGISRSRRVLITRSLQDPPPSSAMTSEYDSSIAETTSASYTTANAGPLTLTCGASGEVELSAPLSTTTLESLGTYHCYGKWQVSPAGAGTWSDVDTEIMSNVAAENATEGSISVNQTATGLTASSDYDFQLLLRNDSGTATLYYAGTATATTS